MPDDDLMRLLRSARNDTPYVNLLKSLTIVTTIFFFTLDLFCDIEIIRVLRCNNVADQRVDSVTAEDRNDFYIVWVIGITKEKIYINSFQRSRCHDKCNKQEVTPKTVC
jgi:hypothetical protein